MVQHNNLINGYERFLVMFLGVFAKLWKVITSFIMPVCPSILVEKLGFHWMDFHEIWYLSTFWNSVKKTQVSLNSDKNNRYFTWRCVYIYDNILMNYS
jgi:hypothetical protein